MISVSTALDALLDLVTALPLEDVDLRAAVGRVLNGSVIAHRDQPPFSASAMDGYAIYSNGPPDAGTCWTVVGQSAAGHGFAGAVNDGEADRIFTGAPPPAGTNRVIIQEDVERSGDTVILQDNADTRSYVRPAGADFKSGDTLDGPLQLTSAHIALCAAMNAAQIQVTRKPVVAIIGTGDELCQPGETPSDDQIIASNTYGLAALLEQNGAVARILPVARDTITSLQSVLDRALDCDLIVSIGGASVGDHDLVASAAKEMGLQQSFYRVAMRPGKPLMAGRIKRIPMIGLPGNPVSAMVCGHVFLLPVIRKMLGMDACAPKRLIATLRSDMPANGPREHYMRAVFSDGQITAFEQQDSALLTVLANANAFIVRPPNAPAAKTGEEVEFLTI